MNKNNKKMKKKWKLKNILTAPLAFLKPVITILKKRPFLKKIKKKWVKKKENQKKQKYTNLSHFLLHS
jgi:hypothetical protein